LSGRKLYAQEKEEMRFKKKGFASIEGFFLYNKGPHGRRASGEGINQTKAEKGEGP